MDRIVTFLASVLGALANIGTALYGEGGPGIRSWFAAVGGRRSQGIAAMAGGLLPRVVGPNFYFDQRFSNCLGGNR